MGSCCGVLRWRGSDFCFKRITLALNEEIAGGRKPLWLFKEEKMVTGTMMGKWTGEEVDRLGMYPGVRPPGRLKRSYVEGKKKIFLMTPRFFYLSN